MPRVVDDSRNRQHGNDPGSNGKPHNHNEQVRPNTTGHSRSKDKTKQKLGDVGYEPITRSRTERRLAEFREEKRKEDEKRRNRSPPRLNKDGVPFYATISEHKRQWDRKEAEAEAARQAYHNHCKRIMTDRDSLVRITSPSGKKYVYDYRGFKVTEEQFEEDQAKNCKKKEKLAKRKQRKELAARTYKAAHAPHFNGRIIEKTNKYVHNMRRLVKFRYEQANWSPMALPGTTYLP